MAHAESLFLWSRFSRERNRRFVTHNWVTRHADKQKRRGHFRGRAFCSNEPASYFGAAGAFTISMSSTSNVSVEDGGMVGGEPCSP